MKIELTDAERRCLADLVRRERVHTLMRFDLDLQALTQKLGIQSTPGAYSQVGAGGASGNTVDS